MSTALPDIEEEAPALILALRGAGVEARLIGGLAIHQHLHGGLPPSLARTYADIDLVVGRGRHEKLRGALEARGYSPNARFNALHGSRRLLYYDEPHERQLDVFLGELRMSHTLALDDRLAVHATTLGAADLLLTKLQVIQINEKDIADAVTLVHQHELGDERDGDVLALDRLEQVTGHDWGWYTTVRDNLERLANALPALLDEHDRSNVLGKLTEIERRLDAAPKSLRWKTRARVGRRVPWYEVPEEVARDA